jgi:hypothetical protein
LRFTFAGEAVKRGPVGTGDGEGETLAPGTGVAVETGNGVPLAAGDGAGVTGGIDGLGVTLGTCATRAPRISACSMS